jgi:hypothetical protein
MPSAFVDLFSEEIWYFGYFLCKLNDLNDILESTSNSEKNFNLENKRQNNAMA